VKHPRSVCGAPLVFALALALWFASTLGLMHRVLHVSPAAASPGAAAMVGAEAAPAAAQAPRQGWGHGGLLALFGDHANADCQLYDQLAGGAAALATPHVVLPVALPTARFHYFLGEALARRAALFDARGPPSTL
jgi:hypothetical protein